LHDAAFDKVKGHSMAKRKAKAKAKAKKKRSGKADRARISAKQAHEVYYVARKFGVSADTVRQAIKKVGNMRAKVYAELEK
jgi:uncharacterized membrane protein YqiK